MTTTQALEQHQKEMTVANVCRDFIVRRIDALTPKMLFAICQQIHILQADAITDEIMKMIAKLNTERASVQNQNGSA